MRRTARSLSLAAATGAALAALAPAAFAGTVPDDGTSWGSASHSPCPEPGEHEWQPDAPGPAGPQAAVPKSTALDGLDDPDADPDTGFDADPEAGFDADLEADPDAGLGTDPDADPDTGLDAEPGLEAEIPAPGESVPTGPGAFEPKAPRPEPDESRSNGPEPTASRTPGPRPTESKAAPCADTPARQGVHAGGGGAFTDSVPALAVGGLLIAGALGAAAHRVYRDRTTHADG
ncbi:hypothetical protein ACH5AO_26370 [Streptomyces sp. NPDC018964]|uniref:hypothetical protein n=1 Tax=Streptomyces sp. NPDC018964 TaxID=3365058 RepID=UPI003797CAAD